MEKCSKTNHVHIRMTLQEFSQTLLGILFCLRLTDIKCDLFFHTLPVIRHRIIHMNRIPHNISQKTYRIIMKSLRRFDGHITGLLTVTPLCHRNHFSCRTVNNFPPSCNIITGIHLQHIRIQMLHQMNRQFSLRCRMERCHNIHLLNLIRIRFRPCIIFSGCIICCVYLRIHLLQFFRVIRSVTVTDRIRPPPFHQLQCLRYDIHISRNRYSARCTLFTHNTHLSLSLLSLSEPYQFRLYPIPNHKSPEITADNDLFPYLSLTAGSPIPVCIRQAAVSRPLH